VCANFGFGALALPKTRCSREERRHPKFQRKSITSGLTPPPPRPYSRVFQALAGGEFRRLRKP